MLTLSANALRSLSRTRAVAAQPVGRIPTVTLGRYRRYRREAIEAWVEELERELAHAGRGFAGSKR